METIPIARCPRLDEVLRVKEAIRRFDGQLNIKTLWDHLPQKIKYPSYCTIIDYLVYSETIYIDVKGNIGWISPGKTTGQDERKEPVENEPAI